MAARFIATCGVVLLTMLLLAGPAQATVSGACDPDSVGLCNKSLTLLTPTSLQIVLQNNSLGGGLITADAFNLPGAVTATLFSTTDADFSLFTGPISVAPFGSREFSIALDANFEGGGSPNPGIPSGGSATFVLTLSASTGLSESALLAAMEEVIRVRGSSVGDGSDKDLITAVPEPSTLFLIGTGLIGLGSGAFRRLRRRR